jgi:hypothetical protein
MSIIGLELACILTMYIVVPPLGVQAYTQQQSLSGTCDTHDTKVRIEDHGVLHITNNYLEYRIPLPTKLDKFWLAYKFGDEYAWVGNCSPAMHPYDDTYCRGVMTKIQAVGWQ